MKILGISAFYHDSSVALLNEGVVEFALHEERFSRIKHDSGFPKSSLTYLIKNNFIELSSINYIVFYDKPFLKFERLLETYLYFAPFKGYESFNKSIPTWVKDKIFQKSIIIKELSNLFGVENSDEIEKKLLFSEHHLSHSASAFFSSPFSKSAIITMDGVGEWATTTTGYGDYNKIVLNKQINFPHSLGLLYSALTYFLGFKVNSGEYKVMGLAPYGKPSFKNKMLDKLINIFDDGSYYLNQDYFNYAVGLTMTNKKFADLFGIARRSEDDDIKSIHMDLAASVQAVIEEVIINLAKSVKKDTDLDNLCMAGGVALNCVANSRLYKEKIFKNIWVQPAAGDAGGALGAAQYFYYHILENKRHVNEIDDQMQGAFLGNQYNSNEIIKWLKYYKLDFVKLDESSCLKETAKNLSAGKIVGWFSGRSEYGPRALGSRSILADPRPAEMQKKLNLNIKYRESFRPFAPAVLEDYHDKWFSSEVKNEYMLFVNTVLNSSCDERLSGFEKLASVQSKIKSVTHTDLSARVQSVSKKNNKRFYQLIEEFYKLTDVPVLINTSFNVRGEPIVNNPEDAIKAFLGTEMDILVIENFFIEKQKQNEYLYTQKYQISFGKD